MDPVLSVRNVFKSYPQSGLLRRLSRKPLTVADALHDISFDVQPGEMVGLLGPNGAGKTTLLKIISTMLYPSSGEVRIAGVDAAKDSSSARRRMGLVTSDERSFYWRLTGRQNLEFFAALYGVPHQITASRITTLLEALGLAHAGDKPFYTYSSGMKQKMAIGRGLLGEPQLVLYDEPTRALDPLSTRNIRAWMKESQKMAPQTAHLIATNQMDEAEQLCDRLIVLNRGRLVAAGTIPEIRSRFQKHEIHHIGYRHFDRVDELIRNRPSGVIEVSVEQGDNGQELRVHTIKDSEGLSSVLSRILAGGGSILHCQTIEMPLEDLLCNIILDDAPVVAEEVTR